MRAHPAGSINRPSISHVKPPHHQANLYYFAKGSSARAAAGRGRRRRRGDRRSSFVSAMEGLIPFVLDAIRKSNGRGSSYRCVSSDGSSHGSRRNLIDYAELPADARGSGSSTAAGGGWSEFVLATDVRRAEEHPVHARPAAVVAGSAYRRK